jgi:nucleoside-diphosphate-sugar epimerase
MSNASDSSGRTVLVTGASGFLGRRTVEILVKRGFSVRALVRKTSRIDHLRLNNVAVVYGDVTDSESLRSAFEGVDYVIHAAADTSGSLEGGRLTTIQGTRNVLDLCDLHQVKKLIYISTCSVYGIAEYADQQLVDEGAALEPFPEQRGAYSWAKLEAEKLVARFMTDGKTPVVCLRPGTIYGPGGENYTPMIGFSLRDKIFTVIGSGEFVMPLVYVDNLVEAILVAMTQEQSAGEVYTVVDPQRIDKKRYMESFIRKLHPSALVFYLPYSLLAAAVALQEKVFGILKHKPILTSYRLVSSQKPVFYDASKIMKQLGWRPAVCFEEAVARIIAGEPGK